MAIRSSTIRKQEHILVLDHSSYWPDGKPARVNYGSENVRASMTRYDFMEALEDANIPYDSSAPTFDLMELFDKYVVPMYEAKEDEY